MSVKRRHAKMRKGRKALALAFGLAFLLFGGLLLRDVLRASRERAANAALLQRVMQPPQPYLEAESAAVPSADPSDTATQAPTAAPTEQPDRNYLPLLLENGDLAAWLTVDGEGIDYPVMYTPEEPEYYLRKAFDGSYALSGSLFIGADSAPDGSNILIYGHNMKDGSMFGDLERYADEEYAREHPEIVYDLINSDGSYERLTFEVMAAFYGRAYRVDEEGVFRYYYCTDLTQPEEFRYYIEQVAAASLYDLGVTAEYGDRVLTLSTCSYHTSQGRFIVVAREKSEPA